MRRKTARARSAERRELSIQCQRKSETDQSERGHRQQNEIAGIADGSQEHCIAEQACVILDSDELRAAEQIRLVQAQPHAGEQRIDEQYRKHEQVRNATKRSPLRASPPPRPPASRDVAGCHAIHRRLCRLPAIAAGGIEQMHRRVTGSNC
jgi:hypothetical protein